MQKSIGSIIKELRTERGMTQTELAQRLHITTQAISKWENGLSMPDVALLVPLADAFGVSIDVLFGRNK